MSIQHYKKIQEQAEHLANALQNAKEVVGRGSRSFVVEGTDPNELKKVYAFFCHHNELRQMRQLLEKLPESALCRTNRTRAYYKNIDSAFRNVGVYDLSVDDAKAVIGWACRLV